MAGRRMHVRERMLSMPSDRLQGMPVLGSLVTPLGRSSGGAIEASVWQSGHAKLV